MLNELSKTLDFRFKPISYIEFVYESNKQLSKTAPRNTLCKHL